MATLMSRARRAAAAGGSATAATLTYAYAVLPAGTPADAALAAGTIAGIDGAPVSRVEQGGLLAAVSKVPAAEFEEEPLNRSMRDLAWLGPRAEAHQAVNARLATLTDALLPLAFGAIYRTADSLRAFLVAQREPLQVRLDSVRGHAEWVLSLRRDDDVLRASLPRESEPLRALAEEIAASAAGRAYLLRRRQREVQREESQRFDLVAASAVTALVEAMGGRTYPERIVAPAAGLGPAPGGRLIFRLSALVGRAEGGRLLEAVQRYAQAWQPRGYSLTASGPWPPYRFGALDAPDQVPSDEVPDDKGRAGVARGRR
jgi:hypothetical protein